jgi:wobble nucleotide-excising tRNase
MIKKLTSIRNVGRFANFTSTKDQEFGQFTLIYAENGRGKTTLASILRSIAKGDSTLISERKTIGVNDAPEIHVQIDADDFHFDGTSWNRTYSTIEIFDSTFINQNVYAGYYVDVEHKRGLYRFLVGEEGIKLSEKIDGLSDKISSEINPEVNRLKSEIQSKIEGDLSLEKFIALKNEANLLDEIKKTHEEIAALHEKENIIHYRSLQVMELPAFDIAGLVAVLQQSISTVSQEAVNKLKTHVESCMDAQGESWIRTGLDYVKGNTCPFCGQSLDASDLAKHYEAYFSEAYKNLKVSIQDFKHEFETLFSDNNIQVLIATAGKNDTAVEFWSDFRKDIVLPHIATEEYIKVYEELRQQVLASLDRKIGNPLDQIVLDKLLDNAYQSYVHVLEQIKLINSQIESFNTIIQDLKTKTGIGDLVQAETKRMHLKNIQSRHSDEVAKLCNDYTSVQTQKKELENTKSDLKSKLDTYTTNLLSEYGSKLNHYLEVFNARFRVHSETKVKYTGGKPSTQYFIEINSQRLELGDDKTTGEPSFRTLLSEGDKHTLALAFFMARLSLMSDSGKLKDTIVVFDDPVSSLDLHRRRRTGEQICKVAREAKQVNVLSHDAYFAKDLKDALEHDKSITKTYLQINIDGANQSKIDQHDIDNEARSNYQKDYFTLANFRDNGANSDDERLKVARAIRPVLEGYYKAKFPEDCRGKASMLGGLIGAIGDAKSNERLSFAKPKRNELITLNEYTRQFHHGQSPDANTYPISDTELKANVDLTLKHIYE